jgi:hypothetical protein
MTSIADCTFAEYCACEGLHVTPASKITKNHCLSDHQIVAYFELLPNAVEHVGCGNQLRRLRIVASAIVVPM